VSATAVPEKVYIDEIVGIPMLAFDHEIGAVVAALVVKSGNESKILVMTQETAHALGHAMTVRE